MDVVCEGEEAFVEVVDAGVVMVSHVLDCSRKLCPELLDCIRIFVGGGFGLDILVGIAHFSQMPGDDGPGQGFPVLFLNISGELHCRVELVHFEGLPDVFLDLLRLLVLALVVHSRNQRSSLHFLCGSEFAVLVEDGRVA